MSASEYEARAIAQVQAARYMLGMPQPEEELDSFWDRWLLDALYDVDQALSHPHRVELKIALAAAVELVKSSHPDAPDAAINALDDLRWAIDPGIGADVGLRTAWVLGDDVRFADVFTQLDTALLTREGYTQVEMVVVAWPTAELIEDYLDEALPGISLYPLGDKRWLLAA